MKTFEMQDRSGRKNPIRYINAIDGGIQMYGNAIGELVAWAKPSDMIVYTLRTKKGEHLPVFVHSHHIHQHEKSEQFGVKSPIYIDHLICF